MIIYLPEYRLATGGQEKTKPPKINVSGGFVFFLRACLTDF